MGNSFNSPIIWKEDPGTIIQNGLHLDSCPKPALLSRLSQMRIFNFSHLEHAVRFLLSFQMVTYWVNLVLTTSRRCFMDSGELTFLGKGQHCSLNFTFSSSFSQEDMEAASLIAKLKFSMVYTAPYPGYLHCLDPRMLPCSWNSSLWNIITFL